MRIKYGDTEMNFYGPLEDGILRGIQLLENNTELESVLVQKFAEGEENGQKNQTYGLLVRVQTQSEKTITNDNSYLPIPIFLPEYTYNYLFCRKIG